MMIFMGPYFRSIIGGQAATGGSVPPVTIMTIIGYIIYVFILALTYPILTAVNVVHYNSLRSEKEHKDLDNQLDALDKASPAGA